jgi:chromosome segregation protein
VRIARLKAVGFRGIRELIDLELPSTFTVITGRNGAGKSTICDAIEFALTGTLSKPYMHVEKREDLLDYVWWRGPANTSDHFVQLTLIRDDGEAITITRRPEALTIDPASDLARELCNPESAPANPVQELCLEGRRDAADVLPDGRRGDNPGRHR